MTITKRYLAELADFHGLHVACEHCKITMTLPFTSERETVPYKCPVCNETWLDEKGTDRNNLSSLFSAIKHLKQLEACKFQLEISPPDQI
jgi:hypothetical protein